MVVVIIVVVVALVLVSAGAFVAVRVSGRGERRRASRASRPRRRAAGRAARPRRRRDDPDADRRGARGAAARAAPRPRSTVAPPSRRARAEPEVVERPRLRDRLGRTRSAFSGAFGRMRGRKIDDETWDELEEALLLADVGMLTTTQRMLDAVRARAKEDVGHRRRTS